MLTLRVVVDDLVADQPGGVGRYVQELTRQLIATAPRGTEVEAVVSACSPETLAEIQSRLPGVARVNRLNLARRELQLAWQSGVVVPGAGGVVHSPSLMAPLVKHDRRQTGDQTVVTVHDTLAWSHPESLPTTSVLWQRAMVKRARKHADAVVVPTHAVAEQLTRIADFGDRLRVIPGAAASTLIVPADADARATQLDLPERFVLTMGSLDARKGVREVIQAMARGHVDADVALLIAGPEETGAESPLGVAAAAGLPEGRVRVLGFLTDADLALVLSRAVAFVFPSRAEGFGLPLVEAFRFGVPVITSDDPALIEVAGDAALTVERRDADGYPARLATAIGRVLHDPQLADRLRTSSADRARAFSWRDSAERVWQLHADL